MHNSCNSCTSHNEIQQAVNDALAFEKKNLEQYENNAAQSASDAAKEAAKAAESASAVAQSQTNAETAASTAVVAASSVTETAEILEATAESIKTAQELLEEQVASVQTKPVYFEVSGPTSTLVLPETDTVFNVRSIYVSSARQAVNYGFTFDKTTRTVTLAEAITADQIAETEVGYILVEVICDVFNSDDPTSIGLSLASNAGATMVGTSRGSTVQQALDNNVAATNAVIQNLASSEDGKGGQLVAAKYPEGIIGTVQGYIDTRESVALNAFMVGAETDVEKFAALQTALEYCNTNFCDLHVYGLTVPVLNTAYINHRHFSIIGHNGAVFDCTQCADTYAFDFVEESTSTGTIWNSLANVVRGFKFLGKSTGRFLNLHNDDPGKVPAFHMAQCLVTGFDTGVRFGSNNWAAKFDTVFFRGNTYDIRNDRETDAGELNLFINCIFGASKAALYDVKGAATFEFAFCRFDYGGPVVLADSGVGKGDIRFTGCHFERNTNVTTPDFNITAGADWYKITATNCIWALNGASRQLGYMNSTDRRARFEIRDCFFNNYALTGEDNSNVEFFTAAGNATVKASGNVVKSGTRNTGVIFSRGSRISPAMNVAAVTAGTVQVNGGGTTGSSTDYPTTNIQFDTALLLTGQKSVWVQVPVVPGEDIQISGWVKRSSLGYTPNLRSFDYFGNRVETQSFSVSETLGEWARFILLYTVPKYCTSVQLHLAFDSSVVTATDTCILHSWMVERF